MTDGFANRPMLVIEDDADIRDALRMLFEEEGYIATFAASLDEGLALVERQAFALVLTDLFTHRSADPLTHLQPLRELADPTPVGILTGWKLTPEQAQAGGFAFVVAKPFNLDELLAQVAASLDTRLDCDQLGQACTVQRYFELLSARDWDGLAALCTPDVLYVLPGDSPYSAEVQGQQAFRDYTAAMFAHFPDARFDNVQVYATPKGLAARYQGHWAAPDNPHQHEQSGSVTFRFAGERIAQIGVQLDVTRLLALVDPPTG